MDSPYYTKRKYKLAILCCAKTRNTTVRSESRFALRLRYADLVASIEVAVKCA
jgi:hypothetical protein